MTGLLLYIKRGLHRTITLVDADTQINPNYTLIHFRHLQVLSVLQDSGHPVKHDRFLRHGPARSGDHRPER